MSALRHKKLSGIFVFTGSSILLSGRKLVRWTVFILPSALAWHSSVLPFYSFWVRCDKYGLQCLFANVRVGHATEKGRASNLYLFTQMDLFIDKNTGIAFFVHHHANCSLKSFCPLFTDHSALWGSIMLNINRSKSITVRFWWVSRESPDQPHLRMKRQVFGEPSELSWITDR